MRTLGLWAVTVFAVLIVGCVEAEPDRTNVVIERDTVPNTTVVHETEKAPDTDVNIDVDTTDDTPDVVIEK